MRAGGRSSSTCSRTSCREGSEEEEGRRTPVARKREREKDSARLDIFEPYDSLPRYLRVSLSRSPVAEVLADLNEYFVSTGMLAPSSCSPAHPCGYPPLSPRANEDPSSVCSQRQGTLSPSLPSSLPPSPSSSPSSASPHLRASSSLPAKPVEGLGLSSSWTLPSSASWVVSRDPLLPSCGLRAPSKAAQLLIHHPLVKEGVVVLQDRASSLAALSADIQPRDCVLDACASPGSKTLHVLGTEWLTPTSRHHHPLLTCRRFGPVPLTGILFASLSNPSPSCLSTPDASVVLFVCLPSRRKEQRKRAKFSRGSLLLALTKLFRTTAACYPPPHSTGSSLHKIVFTPFLALCCPFYRSFRNLLRLVQWCFAPCHFREGLPTRTGACP